MSYLRISCLVLLLGLAACSKQEPQVPPGANPGSDASSVASKATPAARTVAPEQLLETLRLPFAYTLVSKKEVAQRRGKIAHVFTLDYGDGKVKTIDKQLRAALKLQGFDVAAKATKVRGGLRTPYVSADGRRISTTVVAGKYVKDGLTSGSDGRVKLTYVTK
jgi:hypothetical protein